MRKIGSVAALEDLGRIRLSKSFYMRDFLYSDISSFHGIPNIPDDPDLAVLAGRGLCEELLEPLAVTFDGISIRSAYRSAQVNSFGNVHKLNCASNEANYAGHIWDRRDADGCMGATACIVVRWFADRYAEGPTGAGSPGGSTTACPTPGSTSSPSSQPSTSNWHERPARRIDSFIEPKGCLTKPWMDNHTGDHSQWYEGFPTLRS